MAARNHLKAHINFDVSGSSEEGSACTIVSSLFMRLLMTMQQVIMNSDFWYNAIRHNNVPL